MWKLLILTATTIASPVYAQTCAQADAALAQAYTQMKEGGSHSYAGSANENQRDTAETRFHQTLSAYLQQSNSWACRFPRTTRAGIIIHTAPNGHLRSFSWDAQSGGTLREYHNLLQYRTPSGRSATQKGEGILTGIYSDTLGQHGTAYFVTSIGKYSNTLYGQSLSVWQISNDGLRPLNIIRTSKATNTLSYEYSASHSGRNEDFAYDARSKTISFPLVPKADANHPDAAYGAAQVSNRRIRYRFNGEQFVRLN